MSVVLRYAKAIVGAVTPVFVIVNAAISDNMITGNEWTQIVVSILVAVGVLTVPNKHRE